jgi:hypothetical protein
MTEWTNNASQVLGACGVIAMVAIAIVARVNRIPFQPYQSTNGVNEMMDLTYHGTLRRAAASSFNNDGKPQPFIFGSVLYQADFNVSEVGKLQQTSPTFAVSNLDAKAEPFEVAEFSE